MTGTLSRRVALIRGHPLCAMAKTRQAQRHGTQAPVNALLVKLVKEAEQKGRGSPGLSPAAIVGQLDGVSLLWRGGGQQTALHLALATALAVAVLVAAALFAGQHWSRL